MAKIVGKASPALTKRNQAAIEAADPLFEQINSSWEAIEQFFRKQGVLRPVEVGLEAIETDTGAVEGRYLIGIQREKGNWRVCYGIEFFHHPEGVTDWTPILDCSLQVRVELLDHVTPLYEELVKSNEEYISEIECAAAKSREVLSSLLGND